MRALLDERRLELIRTVFRLYRKGDAGDAQGSGAEALEIGKCWRFSDGGDGADDSLRDGGGD